MSGLSLKNLEILLPKTKQEMLPRTRQIPKHLLNDHDLNLQIGKFLLKTLNSICIGYHQHDY